MRFAGNRVEDFMKNKPNFGMIADEAMKARSEEKINSYNAAGYVEAADIKAKAGLAAAEAQTGADQFSGIMGGLSSVISGGLGALGKTNVGTTRGVSQFSQPHASGIGREALGGYDL
jgi:hypothetical protein